MISLAFWSDLMIVNAPLIIKDYSQSKLLQTVLPFLILRKRVCSAQTKSKKKGGTFLAPAKSKRPLRDSENTETTEGRTWKLYCFGWWH
jgi:hypothetical protein